MNPKFITTGGIFNKSQDSFWIGEVDENTFLMI